MNSTHGVTGAVIARMAAEREFHLQRRGWTFAALQVAARFARRFPVCLRRLGLAEGRGNGAEVLIAPLGREAICLHGHGVNVEKHGRHSFEADRSARPQGPPRPAG